MIFYLDGYNFLFRQPGVKRGLKESREHLLSRLGDCAHLKAVQIIVVFDAAYHKEQESHYFYHHLKIVFTNYSQSADDWIIQHLIATSKKPCMVITSDKGLQKRAQECGAKVQSCEEFCHFLEKKREKAKKPALKKPEILLRQEQQPAKNFPKEDPYLQVFEQRFASLNLKSRVSGASYPSNYSRWLQAFSRKLEEKSD